MKTPRPPRNRPRRRVPSVFWLLALACAPPEVPSGPAPQAEARLEHRQAPPAPALPPREWSVRMQSWGGFTGMGRGWMSVESRGLMSKVGRCGTTLPAEQRLALETAVANARPEQWQPRYESKLLVTDQMTFVLSFTSDGRQFQASWTSAAQRDVLPSDLAALSAAIWAAQDAYAAPCRVSSSTSPASKAP